jgi:hypothetical protein
MASIDIPEYHEARVLLLVEAFSRDARDLSSLTKLAKLDFLLRYPVFLERLMDRRRIAWPEGAQPSHAERNAVENRMIRYKYGPWDSRYYAILGSLIGRGLIEVVVDQGVISMHATETGRGVATSISSTGSWQVLAARIELLRRSFDKTGNQLKTLIYSELPDAVDHPYWTTI